MTRRLPVVALGVLIVGLALHNLAMATLWEWGIRGNELDVVAAWKEALLAVALGAALWHARRLPPLRAADLLAAVYAGVVVLYGLIPQGWLDGEATTRGELLALRHHCSEMRYTSARPKRVSATPTATASQRRSRRSRTESTSRRPSA